MQRKMQERTRCTSPSQSSKRDTAHAHGTLHSDTPRAPPDALCTARLLYSKHSSARVGVSVATASIQTPSNDVSMAPTKETVASSHASLPGGKLPTGSSDQPAGASQREREEHRVAPADAYASPSTLGGIVWVAGTCALSCRWALGAACVG
eukprot:m.1220092 g.1220092  ORF g.1220092 m.1220092 type:complete len:151 (+) comp24622_c0_seq37:253-705(+)